MYITPSPPISATAMTIRLLVSADSSFQRLANQALISLSIILGLASRQQGLGRLDNFTYGYGFGSPLQPPLYSTSSAHRWDS